MKYLLLLVFLPLYVFAQDIPKGAESIELTTSLSDSLLLEKAVSFLNANDYVVDKLDSKRGQIVTQSKPTVYLLNMRILASVKVGIVTLKGQWSAQAMGYAFSNEPVLNKGMPSNGARKSFKILNDLAIKFSREINSTSTRYIIQAN